MDNSFLTTNHHKSNTKKFQVEFFKLAVEFEEEGTGTIVKEETSASLKDKVSEPMQNDKQRKLSYLQTDVKKITSLIGSM